MKHKITDALQVIAAILLTGGTFAVAAPLPKEPVKQENKTAIVEQVKPAEKPVEAPQTAPTPEKVVTWQDNPNGCTDAQWIDQNAPFKCIDKPAPAPASASPGAAPSGGNCESWMAAAGIPLTHATRKLIINESGCRPHAVNPSSGACGIPQALPCSKMACPLNDSGAVCQLKWMDGYVKNRYGTWENALATWYSRCGSPQGCWY